MTSRLFLALLLPFLAAGLQWLLWEEWIKPYVWFLFFPAAFFSAWLGGLRGGLGGTVISALLVWLVFIPPQFSFALQQTASIASVVIFVIMGGLFAGFFERLQQARRRSESRFEATFEQAAMGIALVATDGRWLRVNRRLCEILGYRQDELLAMTFQDITHPDDLNADQAQMRRMLTGEIPHYGLEKRYLRQDGSLLWVHLNVALVRKPDGAPDYFISVVEDITSRKEAEAHLDEARRLAGLGHWHWDLRTGAHTWSEEIYRTYGRDSALPAAVYPEVQQYFTPESWAHLAATVEQSLAEGRAYECDAEVVRPDGEHRWITARGQATRDVNGKIIVLQGTVQDITRRKQAEMALADSEHRYRELVENANSAIVHWSRDGRVTFFNEFAQRLFGWHGDEIIGRHIGVLLPERESTGAGLSGLVEDIAAHPERYLNNINENLCRSGRRLWMNWTNRALRDEQGRLTGILSVGNDITEQKHAQDELLHRNRELERFDQASVGRELEMIDLKRRINMLSAELGRTAPYDLSFTETPPPSENTPA